MKKQKILFRCFEVIFIIVVSLVFLAAVTGTKRNVVWYKELFVTVVMFGAMLFLFWLLTKAEPFLEKHEKKLFIGFVLIWSVALYTFCYLFHNEPAHDYATICQALENYINGQEVNWAYFAQFKNNFFLFALLLALTRAAQLIGLPDPFVLWLLVSTALVIWSGICVFRLVKLAGGRTAAGFFALLLFAGFVPLWGGTYNLYTDCISLCIGVWACYLLAVSRKKKHSWLFVLAAGAVWGIGFAVKATVAVCLVAVVLIAILTENWKKWLRLTALILAGFLIAQVCVEGIWLQFPCSAMEDEYGAPFSYWFALGLCGDGSDPGNAEFAVRCLDAPGTEAKHQVAMEHIRDNLQELWNPDHLLQKARYNFASGSFGLPDFNRYNVNIMYEFFNDYGIYGGYTIMYTSGYFYAILLFGILGSILSLVQGDSGKVRLAALARMTVLGLVIFLMLFEANNRQLYNHMPWFALMGAFGCDSLWKKAGEERKRKSVS